ncbi:hypothetical protein QW060_06820 [Myroides ceti]|uniref:Uncharacterized protein n=2 Tax=Paenimyroides ceti TaxID=395087 RepID=A0ABT8CTF1_9FLAO|nr:hypothetical protein [Paenimyroides ceti]MDN3706842.1 hypothetical protein [Paenimyroides ceti]
MELRIYPYRRPSYLRSKLEKSIMHEDSNKWIFTENEVKINYKIRPVFSHMEEQFKDLEFVFKIKKDEESTNYLSMHLTKENETDKKETIIGMMTSFVLGSHKDLVKSLVIVP